MTSLTLTPVPVKTLRDAITGSVSVPGDPDFDAARATWNLAVDQHPAAVAIPATVDDVIEIVRFANAHALRLAPQASGHNVSPIASLQDTILVRTHELRGVEIDPVNRRARVAAGTEWKEVTGPASEHGLAALGLVAPDQRRSPTRWAAASGGSGASTASRPAACWRSRSSPPTGVCAVSTPSTTPTCSGRCAAAAATSAS